MTLGFVAAGIVALFLLFVLAPGVFLRLGLLLYPKDHYRRREFEAEFHCVPRRARPRWVAGQLVTFLLEAPSARAIKGQAQQTEGRLSATQVDAETEAHLNRIIRIAKQFEEHRRSGLPADSLTIDGYTVTPIITTSCLAGPGTPGFSLVPNTTPENGVG